MLVTEQVADKPTRSSRPETYIIRYSGSLLMNVEPALNNVRTKPILPVYRHYEPNAPVQKTSVLPIGHVANQGVGTAPVFVSGQTPQQLAAFADALVFVRIQTWDITQSTSTSFV